MKALPKEIKTIWYIVEAIGTVIGLAIVIGLQLFLPKWSDWTLPVWVLVALYAAIAILTIGGFGLVHYRYAIYHYRVNETDIEIQKGFFFRRLTAIPIDRIQNVDLDQGPLLQLFHLQKVVLVTGGSHYEVEALKHEEAVAFKDQVMQLAKEARHEA